MFADLSGFTSIAERLDIAKELSSKYPNIEVMAFRGLLRDFVVEVGGKVVVRGLRAVSDFEYEFQMAGMNRKLMPEVETVFLTPSDKYQFISSTFVREIATLKMRDLNARDVVRHRLVQELCRARHPRDRRLGGMEDTRQVHADDRLEGQQLMRPAPARDRSR